MQDLLRADLFKYILIISSIVLKRSNYKVTMNACKMHVLVLSTSNNYLNGSAAQSTIEQSVCQSEWLIIHFKAGLDGRDSFDK